MLHVILFVGSDSVDVCFVLGADAIPDILLRHWHDVKVEDLKALSGRNIQFLYTRT